jgi:hypothetical protein
VDEKWQQLAMNLCSLCLTIIGSIAEAADKDFPQGDACDTIIVRATAVVVIVVHVLVGLSSIVNILYVISFPQSYL